MSEAAPAPGDDLSQPVDILRLREMLGSPEKPISQSELARRCNTAPSTIYRYETEPTTQRGPLLVLLHKLFREVATSEAA